MVAHGASKLINESGSEEGAAGGRFGRRRFCGASFAAAATAEVEGSRRLVTPPHDTSNAPRFLDRCFMSQLLLLERPEVLADIPMIATFGRRKTKTNSGGRRLSLP